MTLFCVVPGFLPKPKTTTVEIYEGQALERYCYFGAKLRPSLDAGWRFVPSKHLAESERGIRIKISVIPRFVILQIPSIEKQDEGIWECVNNNRRIVHRLKLVVRGAYNSNA